MSTDALTWFAQADIDSPWRRLFWTLPLALLICAAVFFWFTYSMEHSAKRTPEPLPVDAVLVEMPTSTQKQPPSRQKSISQPKIRPDVQPDLLPAVQKELANKNTTPVPPSAPPAASTASTQPQASAPIETHGAQTIARPLPVIPDELREEAMRETATARFHIAVDGNITVELIKPTQNPRLNRLLMDTLRQWKFFPAMKEGRPVSSVEDIVIRIQVQ